MDVIRRRRKVKTAAIFAGAAALTLIGGMALTDRGTGPAASFDSGGSKPDVETCNNLASGCHLEEINSPVFAFEPRSGKNDLYPPAADRLQPAGAGDRFTCAVASITDGDTLRCTDGTRVRIAGINAREKDGSCKNGAPCPLASDYEATAALSAIASGETLECQANGTTYNRVAAFCRTAAGVDVSCAMLDGGTVARWDRHWNGHSC